MLRYLHYWSAFTGATFATDSESGIVDSREAGQTLRLPRNGLLLVLLRSIAALC